MPGNFKSPDGDLENLYVTEYDFIDRYVTTGSLWVWGRYIDGRLGTNDTIHRSSPVQTVSGGTNWKQIACGQKHTAAIKTDGTLWLWGVNYNGQLGDNTRTNKSSPVQTVSIGTNWRQVSAGYHTAAIKNDGTLWVWGYNVYGQLGTNDTTDRSSPAQTVAGGNNWKQVSVGDQTSAAIKTDGTLWTWGYNDLGQLGNNASGSGQHKSSPVQTVSTGTNWKQVAVGNRTVAAIKTDGTLWTWGRNYEGNLGDNSIVHKSSPVQTVSAGTNWKFVSVGLHVAAIKTDGTLWMWGNNTRGPLGDNSTVPKSSPVQTVSAGNNWKQVSAGGYYHTAAVKTDGTLWTWGRNDWGQLGNNGNGYADASSPIQTLSAGTNWKQVSCGNYFTSGIYFYDANNQYPSS